MKVTDAIEYVRFNTATVHDLSGRGSNNLFSNKNIIHQMKLALLRYANFTKALEGIYSLPIDTSTRIITMPNDVVRCKGYRFAFTWVDGRKYPMDMSDLNQVHSEFPYDTYTGINRWLLPWSDKLYVYPKPQESYTSTTLSKNITSTETTITVASVTGLQQNGGRITINDEKIEYKSASGTTLSDCTRGVENTTAASHLAGNTVKENNCHIFYYKKHFEIPLFDDDTVDPNYVNREMEVDDEHMQVILDHTTYLLLKKVDKSRAESYKIDWEPWLIKAKADIKQGRSDINNGGETRASYDWERQSAFDVY